MDISPELVAKMRCPCTGAQVRISGLNLEHLERPDIQYPIVNGIPVLICDSKSLFSVDDFQNYRQTTFNLGPRTAKDRVMSLVPSISVNVKARENYQRLSKMLPKNSKILVIGGSIAGHGMEPVYDNTSFEIVGSDVSFGPNTKLICDAHNIPFEDDVFDCVIIQAVLEHVVDPYRCVSEVFRVLKSQGIVYAETPFMQQVHMKQYDFTRFTHLGHRRLFRHFEELSSGPTCGPGMALAWSYTYFLASFSSRRVLNRLLVIFARCTSFFLKYFDYYLIDKPGSYDAASGFFFMGRKSDSCLSDKELIKQFRGNR